MSKSVYWSRHVNPDDGYAYSKIELEGLWELPVLPETMVRGREKRFAFFSHCAGKFNDAKDKAIAALIARAAIAEVIDPNPIEPEPPVPECFHIDPTTGLIPKPKETEDAG